MNIPQEFEDVFQGVELTEDEIRTLNWIVGWESRTVGNLRSAIQKAQTNALSTLQAENEKLRAELEQVKRERDAAVNCIKEIEDALNFQRISAISLRISEWRGQKEG